MFPRSRLILAALVVIAAFGVVAVMRSRLPDADTEAPETPAIVAADVLPALLGATGWLNGDPRILDSLGAGPLVLAVWSDTDPRCLDGLPRVESWHEAYGRYGVRVVGVYAPDFSFGVDSTVPLRIARRLGLEFPIALDPSYLVRSRLALPAEQSILVLDPEQRLIASSSFGQPLDRIDRALRAELRRLRPDLDFPAEPEERGNEAPPRTIRLAHLGAGRVATGPLATAIPGRTETFTTQFRFQEEGLVRVPVPVGRWTVTAEGATAARGGAADFVAIRNPGERLYAVMSPRSSGGSRVWVLADEGWLSGAERGADVRVDARGASYVDVTEPRLHELSKGGRERVLRLSPEQPGLTIHAFVFEEGSGESR